MTEKGEGVNGIYEGDYDSSSETFLFSNHSNGKIEVVSIEKEKANFHLGNVFRSNSRWLITSSQTTRPVPNREVKSGAPSPAPPMILELHPVK